MKQPTFKSKQINRFVVVYAKVMLFLSAGILVTSTLISSHIATKRLENLSERIDSFSKKLDAETPSLDQLNRSASITRNQQSDNLIQDSGSIRNMTGKRMPFRLQFFQIGDYVTVRFGTNTNLLSVNQMKNDPQNVARIQFAFVLIDTLDGIFAEANLVNIDKSPIAYLRANYIENVSSTKIAYTAKMDSIEIADKFGNLALGIYKRNDNEFSYQGYLVSDDEGITLIGLDGGYFVLPLQSTENELNRALKKVGVKPILLHR